MTEIEKAQKVFWTGCIQHLRDTYSFLKGKRVYIYGSGELGTFLCRVLVAYAGISKNDIKGFINDFGSGFAIYGIPVFAFEQCDFSGDDYCVVVGLRESGAVIERLKQHHVRYFMDTLSGILNVTGPMFCALSDTPDKMSPGNMLAKIRRFHELGLPEKEMEQFYGDEESLAVLHNRLELYGTGRFDLLDSICPVTTQEYFGPGLPKIGEHEFYVDCGAYTGDSVQDFIEYAGGKYDKIVAFEPDPRSFAKMERALAGMDKIELVKAATGRTSGEVLFGDGHNLGSAIDLETGTQKVRLVCLDDFLKGPVTFVKMDIEGAELDTLMGMERLLKEYRPTLAVCVYHKVEDIYTIPKYIKSVVPEYRLKLRQHRPCIYGTVLYAEV